MTVTTIAQIAEQEWTVKTMAEFIEREALPQKRERGFFLEDDFNAGWNACLNNIKSIPAAYVRPVVRGKWITVMYHLYECSECGAAYQDVGYGFNFCPNCGAMMEES